MAAELVDQLELAVAEALFAGVADTFGRVPQRVELGVDMDECLDAFRTLQSAEAWAAHGRWITEARPTLGPATEARFRAASEVTPAQVTSASAVRDRISDLVRSATADGTVLIGPAAAGAAPRRDGLDPVADRVRASTRSAPCRAPRPGLLMGAGSPRPVRRSARRLRLGSERPLR